MITTSSILQQLYTSRSFGNKMFMDGFYPSYRTWFNGLYHRPDNTAFFSSAIAFNLVRLMSNFNAEEKKIAQVIIDDITQHFYLYQNKDGHDSYNFWQTKPSLHFSNGYFARHFNFFMIPDDIDDSALIHLCKQQKKENQHALKTKMQQFALGILKWPDMPIKGYEKLMPYNTFFVKNMPACFDVCALSNILYFIYQNKLTLNIHDHDSLKCIVKAIETDDYINKPFAVSPYYPNPILILYHITRLMVDFEIKELYDLKLKMLQHIAILKTKTTNKMALLILAIVAIKLTGIVMEVALPNKQEKENYTFFVAGLLTEMGSKKMRKCAHLPSTHIKYKCAAYAESLILEYTILLKGTVK